LCRREIVSIVDLVALKLETSEFFVILEEPGGASVQIIFFDAGNRLCPLTSAERMLMYRLSMKERVRDPKTSCRIPGASNRRIVPIEALQGSELVAWWYVARNRRSLESKNIEKMTISDSPQDTFTFSFDKSFFHFFISDYLDLRFGRLRSIGDLTSYIRNIEMIHLSRPAAI
jgi:hypothetical protein